MGRHCQSLGANGRVEGGQNTSASISIPARYDLHTCSLEGRLGLFFERLVRLLIGSGGSDVF